MRNLLCQNIPMGMIYRKDPASNIPLPVSVFEHNMIRELESTQEQRSETARTRITDAYTALSKACDPKNIVDPRKGFTDDQTGKINKLYNEFIRVSEEIKPGSTKGWQGRPEDWSPEDPRASLFYENPEWGSRQAVINELIREYDVRRENFERENAAYASSGLPSKTDTLQKTIKALDTTPSDITFEAAKNAYVDFLKAARDYYTAIGQPFPNYPGVDVLFKRDDSKANQTLNKQTTEYLELKKTRQTFNETLISYRKGRINKSEIAKLQAEYLAYKKAYAAFYGEARALADIPAFETITGQPIPEKTIIIGKETITVQGQNAEKIYEILAREINNINSAIGRIKFKDDVAEFQNIDKDISDILEAIHNSIKSINSTIEKNVNISFGSSVNGTSSAGKPQNTDLFWKENEQVITGAGRTGSEAKRLYDIQRLLGVLRCKAFTDAWIKKYGNNNLPFDTSPFKDLTFDSSTYTTVNLSEAEKKQIAEIPVIITLNASAQEITELGEKIGANNVATRGEKKVRNGFETTIPTRGLIPFMDTSATTIDFYEITDYLPPPLPPAPVREDVKINPVYTHGPINFPPKPTQPTQPGETNDKIQWIKRDLPTPPDITPSSKTPFYYDEIDLPPPPGTHSLPLDQPQPTPTPVVSTSGGSGNSTSSQATHAAAIAPKYEIFVEKNVPKYEDPHKPTTTKLDIGVEANTRTPTITGLPPGRDDIYLDGTKLTENPSGSGTYTAPDGTNLGKNKNNLQLTIGGEQYANLSSDRNGKLTPKIDTEGFPDAVTNPLTPEQEQDNKTAREEHNNNVEDINDYNTNEPGRINARNTAKSEAYDQARKQTIVREESGSSKGIFDDVFNGFIQISNTSSLRLGYQRWGEVAGFWSRGWNESGNMIYSSDMTTENIHNVLNAEVFFKDVIDTRRFNLGLGAGGFVDLYSFRTVEQTYDPYDNRGGSKNLNDHSSELYNWGVKLMASATLPIPGLMIDGNVSYRNKNQPLGADTVSYLSGGINTTATISWSSLQYWLQTNPRSKLTQADIEQALQYWLQTYSRNN